MTRPAGDDDDAATTPDVTPADPAGVGVDLLGVVAYGELAAFTRLAADAARASDLAEQVELAARAAVEMEHFGRVRERLATQGVDVITAMAPFAATLDAYHRAVAPRDAAESLVAAHLGRGLVADVAEAVAVHLGPEDAELVRSVLADPDPDPVARVVRRAAADERTRDRLVLGARRLLGEALVAATALLDAHPALTTLVDGGADAGGTAGKGRRALVKSVKSRHGKRVAALGL